MAAVLVQNTEANAASVTLGSSVSAGNCLVACIFWHDVGGTVSITSVTDNNGNTWTLHAATLSLSPSGTLLSSCQIASAPNANSGSTTITPNMSSGSALSVHALEWSGAATASPFDGGGVGSGLAAASTTIGATTSADNDFSVTMVSHNASSTPPTVSGGYTDILDYIPYWYASTGVLANVGLAAAKTVTWTFSGAADFVSSVAYFKTGSTSLGYLPNPFAKPGIGGPPVIAKQFAFQGSTFIPPTGGGSFTGTPIAGQLIKTGQNPALQTALNLTTVAGNKPITGGIPTLTFARNLSTVAGNLLKSGQVPTIVFQGSYVQTTIPGNKPISGLVPNIIIQAPRTGGGGYPYEDVPWTREQNRKLRARIDEETAKHKKLERELVVAEKTLEKAPVRRIEAARNDVERKHQQLMAVAKELMRLHDEVSRETRRRDDDDAVILLLH